MMKRTEAREAAFLLLFEHSFSGEEGFEMLKDLAKTCWDVDCDAYTETLYRGVSENTVMLDERIDRFSEKWKSSRLSRVMLTALRIAMFELELHGKDDAAVYINEAVELIKNYDSVESAKYANGILGSYVASL